MVYIAIAPEKATGPRNADSLRQEMPQDGCPMSKGRHLAVQSEARTTAAPDRQILPHSSFFSLSCTGLSERWKRLVIKSCAQSRWPEARPESKSLLGMAADDGQPQSVQSAAPKRLPALVLGKKTGPGQPLVLPKRWTGRTMASIGCGLSIVQVE